MMLNEAHLKRIVFAFLEYYHRARPHRALDRNALEPRAVEPPQQSRVVAEPVLGGLHHRYRRCV
ncbi:hypothetical protein AYO44_05920 [Planctomycetaceae bacterium SCGC AG-212-F19]|nr:hypothetical protein AYO44_05920 [Planctomycetaceae bacterium SCGC AG-212-F19]